MFEFIYLFLIFPIFCGGMQHYSPSSFKGGIINKIIRIPYSPEKNENVELHQKLVQLERMKQSLKFCNFKLSKKSKNLRPIMANGKPIDKIPSQGMPSRFNYANQLKIMLENRKIYELMHTKIGLKIHGKCQTKVPDNVFHIFALRKALKTEEQFKECHQNETEHILRIVFALRAGIISTNRCVATTLLPPEIAGEQLRFIGLVFGQLLFRENPIFDEAKNEFHFSANIEPEIDAFNPTECQLISNQFDRQLNAQLTQLIGQPLDNPEESKNEENFCAFFEFLVRRIANDQMEPGDKEKWAELEQKSLLIAKYGPEFPLIAPIMRAFIVFGTDAPKLIVLYKALLGGFINEAQLDAFLGEYFDSKTLKLETKCEKLLVMEEQLVMLSKHYGL